MYEQLYLSVYAFEYLCSAFKERVERCCITFPIHQTLHNSHVIKFWVRSSFMPFVLFVFQVNLYSGALFIQQALQWNLYISVLLLLVATAITTVTGEQHLFSGCLAPSLCTELQNFALKVSSLFIKVTGYCAKLW